MGRTKKHPRDILSKGVQKPSTTPISHRENYDNRIGKLEVTISDLEDNVTALEKRMEELTKMNQETLERQNKLYNNTIVKYSVLLSKIPRPNPPKQDDVVFNSQEIHFENGSIGLDKESLRSSLAELI